jgi:hypothetical protein
LDIREVAGAYPRFRRNPNTFTNSPKASFGRFYRALINEDLAARRFGHVAYAKHYCAMHKFS